MYIWGYMDPQGTFNPQRYINTVKLRKYGFGVPVLDSKFRLKDTGGCAASTAAFGAVGPWHGGVALSWRLVIVQTG